MFVRCPSFPPEWVALIPHIMIIPIRLGVIHLPVTGAFMPARVLLLDARPWDCALGCSCAIRHIQRHFVQRRPRRTFVVRAFADKSGVAGEGGCSAAQQITNDTWRRHDGGSAHLFIPGSRSISRAVRLAANLPVANLSRHLAARGLCTLMCDPIGLLWS